MFPEFAIIGYLDLLCRHTVYKSTHGSAIEKIGKYTNSERTPKSPNLSLHGCARAKYYDLFMKGLNNEKYLPPTLEDTDIDTFQPNLDIYRRFYMDYLHNRHALPNFLTSSLFFVGYSVYDSVFLPQYQKLLKTHLKPVLFRLCFAEHPIYLLEFQFDQYILIKAFRNLLQVLRHYVPRNKSCISMSKIQ